MGAAHLHDPRLELRGGADEPGPDLERSIGIAAGDPDGPTGVVEADGAHGGPGGEPGAGRGRRSRAGVGRQLARCG